MLTRWTDFDRTFAALDLLRRRMEDSVFGRDFDGAVESWGGRDVAVNVFDHGGAFVVRAEVPGFADKDITVNLNQGVLTLAGERKVALPDGATAHRRERPSVKFSRAFALPKDIDAEHVTAELKLGVLTVTLPKKPESQPRQITVKVG